MAASIHVKSKGKWNPVKLDPKLFTDKHFGGLICVEELKDYEIVKKYSNPQEIEKLSDGKSKAALTDKSKRKRKASSVPSKCDKKVKRDEKVVKPQISETEQCDESQKKDHKVSRKKKKLLKWKEKARLRKEAKNAHIVEGQVLPMPLDEDEEKEMDISTVSDKSKNNGRSKQRNAPISKLKTGKQKRALKKVENADRSGNVTSENIMTKSNHGKQTDMSAWSDLYVPPPVLRALTDQGFTCPMPIQSLSLPSAIRDRMDIMGAAQTGSGKTLAFAIPVIHHILEYKERKAQKAARELTPSELSEEEGEEALSSEEMDDTSEMMSEDEDSDNSGNEVDEENSDDDEDEVPPFPGEEDDDEEGDFDNPPNEEDIGDFEEDGTGLVKVLNDVEFDWPEVTSEKKRMTGELLCLVLTPTRELAVQVKNHIEAVAIYTDIKVGLVVGGMAPQKQKRLLKRCPEIVVATPGRLWELIEEGDSYLTDVEDIKFLVIDEADRMVEKGHFEELSILLERINANEENKKHRQTFVFSATLTVVHSGPQRFTKQKKTLLTTDLKLEKLMAKVGMKDRPKVIDLTGRVGTADTLTEAKIHCATGEKDSYLYYLTRQYPGRTLVFANSKDCIRRLSSVFSLLKRNPLTLHADMHQKQRLKNLERFTGDDKGLLLATDVAARGLDIPNVQHVIHYQVPRTTENYVHRSGRTARAYKEGLSVMLVGPEDLKNYKKIIYTLNKNEDLPLFPVEYQYFNELHLRVSLARQIDSQEHRFTKLKHQNNWFQKAAQEVDVELDEELLLNDLGDQKQQMALKGKLKAMKEELNYLLKQPVSSYSFSGKYPTRSGKLELPKRPDTAEDAISCVKKDRAFQTKVLRSNKAKPPKPKQKQFWKKKKQSKS